MKPESTKTLWWKNLTSSEKQQTLYFNSDGELSKNRVIPIEADKKSLENEKEKFIIIMCEFIDRFILVDYQEFGRPRFNLRDILKSLLMMSYHSMSYRRCQSDLKDMKERGLLTNVPPKSTLNRFAQKEDMRDLIERLIQTSATFFIENESTLILDSTWFGLRMYSGGFRKVHDKKSASLTKVRKLHIAVLKNSKIISCAKASKGTAGDSPMFEELVKTTVKNGFIVSRLLADAGYTSKSNYALCKELGILDAYIDFRSNATGKRGKSDLWRERVRMWKDDKALLQEKYVPKKIYQVHMQQ